MTDLEQAFLADIAAQPQDDFPRLAYADWLEEHGQSERAEFIRVQCELARQDFRCTCTCEYEHGIGCQAARGKKLRRRENELLDHWYSDWAPSVCGVLEGKGKMGGVVGQIVNAVFDNLKEQFSNQPVPVSILGATKDALRSCTFRRGFISRITLPCAAFLEHAADITEAVPMLEEVRLSDWFAILYEGDNRFYIVRPNNSSSPFVLGKGGFNTPEEALHDLSRACLAFAREQLARRRYPNYSWPSSFAG